jgi:hypothetical protein
MQDERLGDREGDGRRITRRAAIGTGIAAVGAGAVWAPAAAAKATTPRQLLAALKAEVRDSNVQRLVRSQLLSILGQAGEQLAHGQNLECRQTLRTGFIPLLKRGTGRYGITTKAARRWSADAEQLATALPRRDTGPSAGAGGRVTVFNCYNEPVTGLSVSGSNVGHIAPWSNGRGDGPPLYTPSSLRVDRSKNPDPGKFAFGGNRAMVPWDSFTGEATVRIPSPGDSGIGLDDDLLLFVSPSQMTLMTTRGFVVDNFPVKQQLGRPS